MGQVQAKRPHARTNETMSEVESLRAEVVGIREQTDPGDPVLFRPSKSRPHLGPSGEHEETTGGWMGQDALQRPTLLGRRGCKIRLLLEKVAEQDDHVAHVARSGLTHAPTNAAAWRLHRSFCTFGAWKNHALTVTKSM
jgi:hypothetical protein